VPTADVPRAADHETQVAWVYDWWARLDAWIAQTSGDAVIDQQPAITPSGD
jgi:hypothetical protein